VLALSSTTRNAIAAFDTQLQWLAEFQQQIERTNRAIRLQKERTAFSNITALAATVSELRATRTRHLPEWATPCREFLDEKTAKETTETRREEARKALDHYRTNVFPGYQIAINLYLARFATGFRVDGMAAVNVRGGSSCRYSFVINNTPVSVAGGDPEAGVPSFRNTLSAGDRNALALAFFFASLDQSGDLASKIVIIDDPMSSLDAHRTLTTAQEARKLADRAEQVIVLSHSKGFLSQVWEGADRTSRTAFQLVREGESSRITAWNVDDDNDTDHDQRHALLELYVEFGTGDVKEVARSIRPHLEAYLRVAVPGQFKSGQLLGPFRNICEQRIGAQNQILSAHDTEVLGDLIEYANRFHHDTNPAWQSITINDSELTSFVSQTLAFAHP
jgi:wobble nucleotide-excising tRNase